ncbi:hypothetical protein A8F94_03000 [Bacillus sp. FJAT-27225]|uniref:hypothetical protein n=1 Tax=Bacillus sp. FJAT-27225 TaxID=1743144 RepID=UPI00080C2ECE|nr:hypothetical protein [Bacillus sp. FJAT-27225]OCA90856.1 hypothetical protein A8F94_03000 [Bacillus sp. FJAT-27225]
MFDPTAFDNMKVILEGSLYDMDLAKEIAIIDRKDIVDLASLSREFLVRFHMVGIAGIEAEVILRAGLVNLAAELLPSDTQKNKAGCELLLQFDMKHKDDETIFLEIQSIIESVWGAERKITQKAAFDPFGQEDSIHNCITVEFNRLITESQLSDLPDMIAYTSETLVRLYTYLESLN